MTLVNRRLTFSLIILLLLPTFATVSAAVPASIEIDSPSTELTADGALRLNAVVKDNAGNIIDEAVSWTSSSGSIDSTGLFTPGLSGIVNITATSGGVNQTLQITVTPGWPVSIVSDFNRTEFNVDEVVNLTAHLEDRAGNVITGDVGWRCDNGAINHSAKTWTPAGVGNHTMRMVWSELETQVNLLIVPGAPVEIIIPFGLVIQSGAHIQIDAIAVDNYGNEIGISKAGELTWSTESGTITSQGVFVSTEPGLWEINVTSSSGANGSGIIRVLPAAATGLAIELNSTDIRAGIPVNLTSIRTDVLGNDAQVLLSLSNWTVPSGSLELDGEQVVWTPSRIGSWTIGVNDQGYSATQVVNVEMGPSVGLVINLDADEVRSGSSIVASLMAFDAVGNEWSATGAWDVADELDASDHISWMLLKPGPVGTYSISATWYDNETATVHETNTDVEVTPGSLARMILPETGTKVPSDGVLELSPIFEDEYGNILDDMHVVWMIDGIDRTMEIEIAGGKWAPSSLGMHEIRAMSQGVFAIVDVEVTPGNARHVVTDVDDGFSVASGTESEISISTLDVHGNQAPAASVQFIFDDPTGEINPSPKGDGHWMVSGGMAGEWNLRITAGNATSDVTVTVVPGTPERLIAEIPDDIPEQGTTLIIRVYAIDLNGNRIEVEPSDTTVDCTVGKASHIGSDSWEVEVSEAGKSHDCKVLWSGLIAQRFFDVDAVLFGGGLGDTNSALSMVMVIVFLFLTIMVVLIRRMKAEDSKGDLWSDDLDEEDSEPEIDADLQIEDEDDPPVTEPEPVPVIEAETQQEETTEEMRVRLAEEAKKTGIMQAAPGTVQGETGWYIDTSGELTSWQVSESGEWTRLS